MSARGASADAAVALTPPAGRSHRGPRGFARWAPLAPWAALGLACTYVLVTNPADNKPDLLGGCGWYTVFHTNGPTCGGTRMVWYLLHGDVINAARMHLVALIGAPFAIYALIAWTARQTFGVRLPYIKIAWWGYAAYGVAFLVYAVVLRNLPGFEWFHLDYMQPGIGL